jgi:hypothetical protein
MKGFIMNLHEECLLKYLLNPKNLFTSTEMLKINNDLIEKGLIGNNLFTNYQVKQNPVV